MIEAVTVLLPVFNGMPYLPDAVTSILEQDFEEFELLIIDDGSNDATAEYLATIDDRRVRVVSRENRGLVATLNEGLALATHDWVARIDADDVALPERLRRQLQFLEEHADVEVLSCAGAFINHEGRRLRAQSRPTLQHPPFFDPVTDGNILHSGVIYNRRRILDVGGYRELVPAEDLDLWLRVAPLTKLAAIDEPLMLYRIVGAGVSSSAQLWQHTMWEYVRACADARDHGLPEPDLEAWTAEHTPRGLRRLVAEASPRLRRAGLAWTEGRVLQAAGHGGLAFLCNPALVTRKLRGYFSRTVGPA